MGGESDGEFPKNGATNKLPRLRRAIPWRWRVTEQAIVKQVIAKFAAAEVPLEHAMLKMSGDEMRMMRAVRGTVLRPGDVIRFWRVLLGRARPYLLLRKALTDL